MKAKLTFLIALALIAASTTWADSPQMPDVPGIIGMTPVESGACLAIYVPMDAGRALSGLMWYNNDETIVFPEVLIASGDGGDPEPADDAYPVAGNVTGVSSGWS
ncbi:MAG: hypothetical protein V2I25_17490, partial [Woeseiaceae bacterium]|nr:hypothetical protein [Woeseiaceae bacterium]